MDERISPWAREQPISAKAAIGILRSRSLATLVQVEIERLILSGELAAGEKLNENAIARRLGISRGPVRESFRTLAEMGLVRFEKNRGAFVRQISAEEANEIYEVRAALDGVMGRRLAMRMTPEMLQELRARVDQMDEVAKSGNADAYHPLNVQFHERLVEFAGNGKLAAIYRRLINEITLFRRRTLAHGDAIRMSNAEHRIIVDAIASGNPVVAGKAMHDHIMASGQRMQRALGLYLQGQEATGGTADGPETNDGHGGESSNVQGHGA